MGLFVCSLASRASEISFLKAEQFNQLSKENKIRYLNGVQKIIVGMSKRSPYLADADLQSDSRKPANQDEFAAFDGPPPSAAAAAPAAAPAASAAVAASAAQPAAEARPAVPTPYFVRVVPAAPVAQPAAAPASAPAAPAAKPAAAALPTQVTPVIRTQAATVAKDIRLDTGDSQFRCMHSGFVIEKDPCRGHQKIPDWMAIEGLPEGNRSCSPGFSVCNPVIFGLKLSQGCDFFLQEGCRLKAKPFCAQGALWPTEECHKMATDNGNRGTVVAAEIRSEIQPQLFERFKKDFNSLCNPENIKKNPHAEMKNGIKRSDKSAQAVRDDISKTCGWAKKQTALLNEAFTDIASGGNFYPHRNGQTGSK